MESEGKILANTTVMFNQTILKSLREMPQLLLQARIDFLKIIINNFVLLPSGDLWSFILESAYNFEKFDLSNSIFTMEKIGFRISD